MEHLESREIFCFHRPKFMTVSAGLGYKTLTDWIRCLYNNEIGRLFVATRQSINDTEQMLRLDASQLAQILVFFMH